MKTIKIILNTLFFFFLIQLLLSVYSPAEIYKYKNEKGVWCYTNKPVNLPEDSEKIKNTKLINLE